ncbi:MAG: PEGA domain-containing protein, partial [Acetatifactor sp.]|nr:PEGA domain-containing protein [Acetatifactor sp.]
FVDAPEVAEVYLDGNYVGIAPTSFPKSEGSHIITLRRSGCETRSYTISVDGEYKDITYSFAELLPGVDTAVTTPESPAPTPDPAAVSTPEPATPQ